MCARVHPLRGSNAPETPLLVTLSYYLMQWGLYGSGSQELYELLVVVVGAAAG